MSLRLLIPKVSYIKQSSHLPPRRLHSRFESSHRKRKVECSNPSGDKPKSFKHVVIAPRLHGQTFGNRCECHESLEKTIINECPVSQLVCHANQHFTGNGDVSIWVKNSQAGRKNPIKHIFLKKLSSQIIFIHVYTYKFIFLRMESKSDNVKDKLR